MNYPRRQYKGPRQDKDQTPSAGAPAQRPASARNYFSASPDDIPAHPSVFPRPRPAQRQATNQVRRPVGQTQTSAFSGWKKNLAVGAKRPDRKPWPPRPPQAQVPHGSKPKPWPERKAKMRAPTDRKGGFDDVEKNLPDESGENTEKVKKIPALEPGNVRIVVLGGVEEIGKNMMAIELDGDIVVVDIGLLFPGEDAPGVDYIIPDTTYLEERKDKIRGVIITHAHLDHIGGVPYIMPKLGNPPIYTSLLTAVMIKKRQEEFPHLPKLNIQVVDHKDALRLGNLRLRFFDTTHTIPDSLGVIIETPKGNIIITGDFKIEHENNTPTEEEVKQYSALGKEKNLILMSDSTNVERPGFSFSEREVQENVKKIIENVKGRVVIGSFASLFERIVYIIMACEALGKRVAVEGRSMKTNIEIAKELGILKVKKGTLISTEEIDDFPDDKIVILATGAQGDEYAALMRMSTKEHKSVKIRKGDTILLSSSVIPGNEKSVQKLKDNLSRLGAKIIHYGIANVHSSGHSYQGELAWIQKMLKPKFFVPVHGHHHMLRVHAGVAQDSGIPEKNIVVPDNGSILEIIDNGEKIKLLKETASSKVVMVDGLGTNNVKEVVIRDRQMLAEDGMFVLIAIIDMKTGKVKKSPDIISRGFIYLKESQDMLRHVRMVTKKTIEDATANMHPLNLDYLKNAVREELGKYLFQKTHKRPIILPVLIEV